MYKKNLKRIIDFILSLISIILLSPLFISLIIIGFFAMKGNPFFCQVRPGKKQKLFKMIKFRSMTNDRDCDGNYLPDDVRLNTYGKFLRKTSLDELPELFNILIGDMSIVGPRPQLKKDLIFMDEEIKKRYLVRPGLTGLAQVNGRNIIGWDEKFRYDLLYIENITFLNDFKIIFKTFIKVWQHYDINRLGTNSDLDYGDWLLKCNFIDKLQYDEILKNNVSYLRSGKYD